MRGAWGEAWRSGRGGGGGRSGTGAVEDSCEVCVMWNLEEAGGRGLGGELVS